MKMVKPCLRNIVVANTRLCFGRNLLIILLATVCATVAKAQESTSEKPFTVGYATFDDYGKAIYVGGLYLPPHKLNESILSLPPPKKMVLKIVTDSIHRKKFSSYLLQGIAINNSAEVMERHEAQLRSFALTLRGKLLRGDTLTIENFSENKVSVKINDLLMVDFTSPTLFNLFATMWVGPVPPSLSFKNKISGRESDASARSTFSSITFTPERQNLIREWRRAYNGITSASTSTIKQAAATTAKTATTSTTATTATTAPTRVKPPAKIVKKNAKTPGVKKTDVTKLVVDTPIIAPPNPEKTDADKSQAVPNNPSVADQQLEDTSLKSAARANGANQALAPAKPSENSGNNARTRAGDNAANALQLPQSQATEPTKLASIALSPSLQGDAGRPASDARPLNPPTKIGSQKISAEKKRLEKYSQDLIAQSRFRIGYPEKARALKQGGKITVKVTIAKNGDLSDISFIEKSQHDLLNRAVVKGVKKAAPFPPIPASLGDKFSFTVPVNFSLN